MGFDKAVIIILVVAKLFNKIIQRYIPVAVFENAPDILKESISVGCTGLTLAAISLPLI
jgi:hypothetical protein